MKSLFVALMAVAAFSSFAEARSPGPGPGGPGGGPMIHPPAPQPVTGDQMVYEALKIRPVNTTAGRVGATTMQKSVGGLTCSEVRTVGPWGRFPKYNCVISRDRSRNDAAIYAALDVRPRRTGRARVGAIVDEKQVGTLTCRSSVPVVPRAVPRVDCNLRRD